MIGGSPKSITVPSHEINIWQYYEDLPKENLFRYIQETNWALGVFRANNYRNEASQWIVKKEKNDEAEWRRLPIHQACICDPNNEIITCILDAYPIGIYEKDDQGRLPIHLACIHGASTYVIYLLLAAYHDSSNEKDNWGKIPKDYCILSSHENSIEVINLLAKGPAKFDFGVSNRIKFQEMELSIGRRLLEADPSSHKINTNPVEENVEILLEEEELEEVPSEVLSSRAIIRELENKLEVSLYSCSELKAQVKRDGEITLILLDKIKEIEQTKSETEKHTKDTVQRNHTETSMLQNKIHLLSTNNTRMKFAFDKLEAAMLALGNANVKKDEEIISVQDQLASSKVSERKALKDLERFESLQQEIQICTDEKNSLQNRLTVAEEAKKTAFLKVSKVEEDAIFWGELCARQKETNEVIAKEIRYLKDEREIHLIKVSEYEKQKEELSSLESKLEVTEIQLDNVLDEKSTLQHQLEEYKQYQIDAENRMDSVEERLWEETERNKNLAQILREAKEAAVQGEASLFVKMTDILNRVSIISEKDHSEEKDTPELMFD
eukprot:CAMPEP_0197841578 /NCGR_PEP_ID=MMETSP1437-20131217/46262_1 /TAXON_ID=49252 ORGANISM="Eucampia antarctica, Strain CCMP1452" /NCGR_SAMPLE_ID=MMETSP1437 /ASSEMBLY_ACC=CAM_ASM_001096 /LENGTH=552 /DNA_ID=CAMNT_0043451361 /DNA_START=183 /DNA_END=1842 /DNA_ORIENTATION=+